MLALLVAFSVISTNAQSVKEYEAKIPFSFNVGQKTFEAGNYVIKISKSAANAKILSLEDESGEQLHSVVAAESGDMAKGNVRLVFNRYDNQRFLAKLMTDEAGFSIAKSRSEKQVAAGKRDSGSKTEIAGLTRIK
jgi:hypothetical protein